MKKKERKYFSSQFWRNIEYFNNINYFWGEHLFFNLDALPAYELNCLP